MHSFFIHDNRKFTECTFYCSGSNRNFIKKKEQRNDSETICNLDGSGRNGPGSWRGGFFDVAGTIFSEKSSLQSV